MLYFGSARAERLRTAAQRSTQTGTRADIKQRRASDASHEYARAQTATQRRASASPWTITCPKRA